MDISNCDGLELLKSIPDNTIDLVLTDPPYIISRDSGMNKFTEQVKTIEQEGKNVKTEKEWNDYKLKNKIKDDKYKENYLKYGNTSGKKYGYKTDYGDWDKKFTVEKLEEFIQLFYKKLRKGGTCIIFFDLWKVSYLKEAMEKYKFKQIRFIEWIKTNPVPLNQSVNYLTNSREIALLGVKKGKPTFNSKYDKGIYEYPIQSGKNRFHPTQKNIKLFEELIKKHTNEGDLVVDPFLGGGTTAIACKNTKRRYLCSELNKNYYANLIKLIG